MSQNIKHGLFFVLGVIALLTTWPHAFDWVANGGNILNPVQFFADAINAGGTAAFLSIDMAIAWLVFMIWVVYDADRIGMGMKWGWFFVALSYIRGVVHVPGLPDRPRALARSPRHGRPRCTSRRLTV